MVLSQERRQKKNKKAAKQQERKVEVAGPPTSHLPSPPRNPLLFLASYNSLYFKMTLLPHILISMAVSCRGGRQRETYTLCQNKTRETSGEIFLVAESLNRGLQEDQH